MTAVVGIIVSAYSMVSEMRRRKKLAHDTEFISENDIANAFASHGMRRDKITNLVNIEFSSKTKKGRGLSKAGAGAVVAEKSTQVVV